MENDTDTDLDFAREFTENDPRVCGFFRISDGNKCP